MNNIISADPNRFLSLSHQIIKTFSSPPIGQLNIELIEKIMAGEEIMPMGREQLTLSFRSAQFYDRDVLRTLNELCQKYPDKLKLYFLGHNFENGFNAAFLEYLPDVKHLSLSALDALQNPEALCELKQLKSLSLEIANGVPSTILSCDNLKTIRQLTLGQLKHTGVDLSPLRNYDNLTHLTLNKKAKAIDSLKGHPKLTHLWLNGLAHNVPLTAISDLPKLEQLKVWFGHQETFTDLQHQNLKRLEVCRVRLLEKINLRAFPSLTHLHVTQQTRLTELELHPIENITHLGISECKSLTTLSELKSLNQLHELVLLLLPNLDYHDLIETQLPVNLRYLSGYAPTGNRKNDKQIRESIESKGFMEKPNGYLSQWFDS